LTRYFAFAAEKQKNAAQQKILFKRGAQIYPPRLTLMSRREV
jgi:hypothetical protein